MLNDITSAPPSQSQINEKIAKETFSKNAYLTLTLLEVLNLIFFGWFLGIPILGSIENYILSPFGLGESLTNVLAFNSLLTVMTLPIALAVGIHGRNIQRLSPASDSGHSVLEPYLSIQPVKDYIFKVNQLSRRLTNAEIEKIESFGKEHTQKTSLKTLMGSIYTQ